MNKKPKISAELSKECAALKALVTRFNQGKSRADSLSQEAIGAQLNMTQGAVSCYLNGANSLNLKFAVGMASLLNVSVEAFSPRLAREHAETLKVIPFQGADGGVVKVSRLDVLADTGKVAPKKRSTHCFEQVKLKRTAINDLAINGGGEHLHLVEAFSDSMQGTFSIGDSLLVDASVEDATTDGVYLLRLHGEIYIRRLQRDFSGGYIMGADNPKYLPIPITGVQAATMKVLGRVVAAYPCVLL